MGRKESKAKAPATELDHEDEVTSGDSSDEYIETGPAQNPNTSNSKRDKAGRKRAERAKKRKLVRWNETLDQRALLAVQHVCNREGVRVPWSEVAAILGDTVTEGALIQHLAKLRNKLEKDGVPVTPSLKRGGKNASANTKTVTDKGAGGKRTSSKLSKKDEGENEDDYDSDGAADTKKKENTQRKKKGTDSGFDGGPVGKKKRAAQPNKEEATSDSDSEPLAKRKRLNQPKKGSNAESKNDKTGSKEKARAKGQSGSVKVKSEQDDDSGSKSSTTKAKADKRRVEVKPEDTDMDDYGNDTDMDDNDEDIVAIGAPFLAQEWSGDSVSSASSDSEENPSKVVALPIGQANAEIIELWQNNEQIGGSDDYGHFSSYDPTPADGSTQLHSHHGQYDNGPVDNSMMMFGNDNGMLSNHGGFNNLNFGNYGDPGFEMGNLGFANPSVAVKRGGGAQLDDSNVTEYGTFHTPFDFDINGTGDQGAGMSGNGGYQYGSALHTSGNLSQNINPFALNIPSNGGHDFSNGFGRFGPRNQGTGYMETSFAPPSTNMGFNSSIGGHRSGVTASTPKDTSHGNDKISKSGVRNGSNGGFGAASSSQAGRRNDRSEQKGTKQEKSAKHAGQPHTGNNSLAGMPIAPFDPTLPAYDDLSGGVGFNESNQNDIPGWLDDQQDFSWTNFLNEDDHNPFGGTL